MERLGEEEEHWKAKGLQSGVWMTVRVGILTCCYESISDNCKLSA